VCLAETVAVASHQFLPIPSIVISSQSIEIRQARDFGQCPRCRRKWEQLHQTTPNCAIDLSYFRSPTRGITNFTAANDLGPQDCAHSLQSTTIGRRYALIARVMFPLTLGFSELAGNAGAKRAELRTLCKSSSCRRERTSDQQRSYPKFKTACLYRL